MDEAIVEFEPPRKVHHSGTITPNNEQLKQKIKKLEEQLRAEADARRREKAELEA